MIVYNLSMKIDRSIENEWLPWQKKEHIPEVMATGMFVSNRLLRVIDSPNEGVTYCVQYVAQSMEDYENYQQQFAPALQEDLNNRFRDKFVAFRTLMEYVA